MSDSSSRVPDAGEEKVEDATRAEEEEEAGAAHVADRAPTEEEAAAADQNALDPDVAAHEREMNRIGAEVKGEGQID